MFAMLAMLAMRCTKRHSQIALKHFATDLKANKYLLSFHTCHPDVVSVLTNNNKNIKGGKFSHFQ